MTQNLALLIHGLVTICLVAAYTTLEALGHDGTPLLGVLAGYLGGAGVQQAAGVKAAP